MKTAILMLAGLLAMNMASAQGSHTIAEPFITVCDGAFLDSGGEGAVGYQDNEDFTSTICPDGGPAISLEFITFTLSTAGTDPTDQLTIYDGPDTSSPLIGVWSGTNSPGIISASFANTSGCLTLVFTSNESGQGVFAAILTCFQPCEPPTPVATMGGTIPALICQGEVLNFDASASFAAPGFNVVGYEWDFDDGTLDSTSGPITSHSFPIPGEYLVQVTLTDDNDCESTSLVDLQIRVSTTPSFEGTMGDTTICLGASLDLIAVATAVPWSGLPEVNYGAGIYLPDENGVPFESTLTVEGFPPGSTLTTTNDLPSVCASMEHSYMGDLVIFLTCPNGQSVTFHQQGGGGTYIGDAEDGETVPPTPGACWDYCWSPTATNGTWIDNLGTSPLPSGTYESVQPMGQLVGCPLNGVWTFTVVDLFFIDDGFLCSWELHFNPVLLGDSSGFTPILGINSPDSAYWSGPGFIPDPGNPLSGFVTPSGPGSNEYTFHVTDNFGCTYDTTITVQIPDLQLSAITGPATVPAATEATFIAAPFLAAADSIVWEPLPSGWSWIDPTHTDYEALLLAHEQLGSDSICATAYGDGCMGTRVCLAVEIVTGVPDVDEPDQSGVHVFPNPTHGVITVQRTLRSEPWTLQIVDELGQTVRLLQLVGETAVIDLTDLASGTYWLTWSTKAGSDRRSFVIER
ncbi:MAG: PKD domain-containing protein [Flavobacteriales bacterium]